MIRQRIITAVVAGALLLALLFAAPSALARPMIAALLIIAAWEWSAFLDAGGRGRGVFVALIVALILPALLWPDAVSNRNAVFVIAVAWWFATLVWTFFYPTMIARPVAWLGGILVIVPAYVALDWLYQLGSPLLLFMLGIVLAADTGAFFVGKAVGRVKLARNISPGKTWEGLIGGLLAVALLIVVESLVFGFPLAPVLALGLAVAMISVIGDLTVSMFKRNAGLKDSGTLFPGHGGFLDRADSVTAAAPLFCLGLSWLKPSLLGLPA